MNIIISAEEYTGSSTSNNRVYCRAELMQVQPNNNKEEKDTLEEWYGYHPPPQSVLKSG